MESTNKEIDETTLAPKEMEENINKEQSQQSKKLKEETKDKATIQEEQLGEKTVESKTDEEEKLKKLRKKQQKKEKKKKKKEESRKKREEKESNNENKSEECLQDDSLEGISYSEEVYNTLSLFMDPNIGLLQMYSYAYDLLKINYSYPKHVKALLAKTRIRNDKWEQINLTEKIDIQTIRKKMIPFYDKMKSLHQVVEEEKKKDEEKQKEIEQLSNDELYFSLQTKKENQNSTNYSNKKKKNKKKKNPSYVNEYENDEDKNSNDTSHMKHNETEIKKSTEKGSDEHSSETQTTSNSKNDIWKSGNNLNLKNNKAKSSLLLNKLLNSKMIKDSFDKQSILKSFFDKFRKIEAKKENEQIKINIQEGKDYINSVELINDQRTRTINNDNNHNTVVYIEVIPSDSKKENDESVQQKKDMNEGKMSYLSLINQINHERSNNMSFITSDMYNLKYDIEELMKKVELIPGESKEKTEAIQTANTILETYFSYKKELN